MFEMIHQLKTDFNHAIARYEQDFGDANPMSITRARDIIDIKGLLNQAYADEERRQRQQVSTNSSRIAHTENTLHNKPSVNASTHLTQNKDKLIEQLQTEVKRLQLALTSAQARCQQQAIKLARFHQSTASISSMQREQKNTPTISQRRTLG